ncbi:hypothetical protein [Thiorhodovibrio frisius]|uniref:Uncharacterized protein n=1 Tax=Thiorhodovibrio frisius TaxID=631362 RepID=H8Z1E1_9GAMM|nr:hypothetical protein [Thiorhodovibrio frisius]EIC22490.1 hypothetical protein Thi970DRAFT_02756 [Thiorhodovibrio frisius]WPL24790.1 hypothetical protein Thiofri_05014 [Thiorhodovibrio frisius]
MLQNVNPRTAKLASRNHIGALLYIFGFGMAGAVVAQDPETIRLFQDESYYNDACRGGSGEEAATWQACGARDYIAFLLGQRGYCYGKENQPGYQQEWHRC